MWDFLKKNSIQIAQHRDEIETAVQMVKDTIAPVETFLEIGVSWGGTACMFSQACKPGARLVLVDVTFAYACKSIGHLAKSYIPTLVCGSSVNPDTKARVASALAGKAVDLLHIDGDHAYAVVKNDLESFAMLVRPGGMIAMHDVAGKPGCIQLWKEFSAAHADWLPRLIRPGVGPGIGIMRRPNA